MHQKQVTSCGDCPHAIEVPGDSTRVGCVAELDYRAADSGGNCEASKHPHLYRPKNACSSDGEAG
jgi:hypothetical protein